MTRLLQENWFRTTNSFGYSYGERRKIYLAPVAIKVLEEYAWDSWFSVSSR